MNRVICLIDDNHLCNLIFNFIKIRLYHLLNFILNK
nr:MAG TPA: hypothetical protein [Crassvirales sp.]DAW87508.1 MAG TPA: hypothetical protein [Bacteriophage sp.]